MKPTVQHHPSCSADYPEKPDGEVSQQITVIDIGVDDHGEHEFVHQCVDCGAFVVVKEQP